MPAILVLALIGAAAGLIASKLMRTQLSLLETLGIGMLGAVIGGLVLRFLLVAMGILGGLVGAILGAMLLIWVYRTYLSNR